MAEVTITINGPVGSGKSKILAEICATLKAIGVPYRFGDDKTKHGVESDMREGHVDFIDLYKPSAVLIERVDSSHACHNTQGGPLCSICGGDIDKRPAEGMKP